MVFIFEWDYIRLIGKKIVYNKSRVSVLCVCVLVGWLAACFSRLLGGENFQNQNLISWNRVLWLLYGNPFHSKRMLMKAFIVHLSNFTELFRIFVISYLSFKWWPYGNSWISKCEHWKCSFHPALVKAISAPVIMRIL